MRRAWDCEASYEMFLCHDSTELNQALLCARCSKSCLDDIDYHFNKVKCRKIEGIPAANSQGWIVAPFIYDSPAQLLFNGGMRQQVVEKFRE